MEHYPNSEPMKHSRRFDFEAFDKLCAEALEEDEAMAEDEALMASLKEAVRYNNLDEAEAEQILWDHRNAMPGQIGGVICRPTFNLVLPEPPEAA